MKKISSLFLALVMVLTLCVPAFAAERIEEDTESQNRSIQRQIDAVMMAVDDDALMRDAMENVIDYSVPRSIRESVAFGAEITSNDASYKNQFELSELGSTVQKVGEINYGNGEIAPMYAAVAAAEVKEDSSNGSKLGAKAWTTIYWIDHYGPDNELYAAEATWDTSSSSYSPGNKSLSYGVTFAGTPVFLSHSTVNYHSSAPGAYVRSVEEYYGLSLGCKSEMEIGPSPVTLTCWVFNGVQT